MREFFKDPLSRNEIAALLVGRSPRDVFSFRSPTFKASGLEPEALTDDQLIDLLAGEPRYFRRPMALIDGRLVAGASERVLAGMFG